MMIILKIRGGGYTYAFYIFYNGSRVITRWYESSKKIKVNFLGEGLYYAVAFIKEKGNEPVIITSLPVQILEKRKDFELPSASVSIFGSCVSRDLLEYDAARNLILNSYIARQSMISALSEKIILDYEEINLQSNFQKRQVYYDFNKCTFAMFEDKVSDYLIIDLVDERFPLIKLSGSYVTRSVGLLESNIVDENVPIIEKEEYMGIDGKQSYRIDGVDIREYMDKFCNRILKIYRSNQIIIHVVKGAEFYFDKNNDIKRFESNISGYFKRLNRMWGFMYEYLNQRLEGCFCIDVSSGYLADENHIWGLSPIHFQKEYYEKVLEELQRKEDINVK